MEYIRWGIEQRIRVLINHAARLDVESIHIVNNEPDLMLVYGPDSLLQVEQERLAIPTDNYALTLFEHARIDKVIFSTDYRWNVTDRNQWNNLYWDSVNNIRETLDAAGQRKVLTTNAESFYKLPRH